MRKAFAAVSLILVCVFCFTFFAGCADVPEVNGSSNVASGEEVQSGGEAIQSESRGDGESNDAASKDSSSKRHTTVSRPASSDNKTSSFAGFVDTNSYGSDSEDERVLPRTARALSSTKTREISVFSPAIFRYFGAIATAPITKADFVNLPRL